MGMVWANFQGLCQLKVITKEHYSNFGSFEIATLLNVPGQYLRKYGIWIGNWREKHRIRRKRHTVFTKFFFLLFHKIQV